MLTKQVFNLLDMSTLSERMKEALRAKGMRQIELAQAIGLTRGAISLWVNGMTKTLEGENLLKAAAALGVSPVWLASGKGPMQVQSQGTAPAALHELGAPRAASTKAGFLEVAVFDARGSMGAGFPVPEYDQVIERIQVKESWVREVLPAITNPKNLALLPAFGDSMEETFSDGDLLWVDCGINTVKIDAIYVLALRDELYVKRLQRRPDGSVLMISDNKAYEPYLIKNGERDEFRVLGRVVFAWRGKRL